jgi:hypothetical protein
LIATHLKNIRLRRTTEIDPVNATSLPPLYSQCSADRRRPVRVLCDAVAGTMA